MIEGQMMDFPLTLTQFLERAGTYFPNSRIVWRRSRQVDWPRDVRGLTSGRRSSPTR